jgi:hypothetical protein
MEINKYSLNKSKKNFYPVESKNQSLVIRKVMARAEMLKNEALRSIEFSKCQNTFYSNQAVPDTA